MKSLKKALTVLFIFTAFVACQKDDAVLPSFKMEGVWNGKIGENAEEPAGQFKLNIKEEGVLERVGSNGSVSASGSWNMKDASFTAVYFYSNGTIVEVNGTVDKSTNKLTGTWSNNGGEQGTLYVNKQ